MDKPNACHERYREGYASSTGPEYMTEQRRLTECLACPDERYCWGGREQISALLKQGSLKPITK